MCQLSKVLFCFQTIPQHLRTTRWLFLQKNGGTAFHPIGFFFFFAATSRCAQSGVGFKDATLLLQASSAEAAHILMLFEPMDYKVWMSVLDPEDIVVY